MPYATINEAWNIKEFTDNNSSYMPLENNKQENINKNFSRNYNRLPEHSGPSTRLSTGDSQQIYIRDNPENRIDYPQNHPSFLNQDLPINEYNLKKYQELNDSFLSKQNKNPKEKFNNYELDSNNSMIYSQPIIKADSTNTKELLEMIRELKRENKKLNTVIEDLKKGGMNNDKDNMFDLIVYLSSGILVIFMMENISKLIRRF